MNQRLITLATALSFFLVPLAGHAEIKDLGALPKEAVAVINTLKKAAAAQDRQAIKALLLEDASLEPFLEFEGQYHGGPAEFEAGLSPKIMQLLVKVLDLKNCGHFKEVSIPDGPVVVSCEATELSNVSSGVLNVSLMLTKKGQWRLYSISDDDYRGDI